MNHVAEVAGRERARSNSPRRSGRRLGLATSILLEQLDQLYLIERALADDLRALFLRSRSLRHRLVLLAQRRETNRQILRLERIVQLATGNADAVPVTNRMEERHPAVDPVVAESTEEVNGSIIVARLKLDPVVMDGYRSAMSGAQRLGMARAADLLAASLREKRQAAAVVSQLATEPDPS